MGGTRKKARQFASLLVCTIFLCSIVATAHALDLQYDANGNLIETEKYKYEYDSFNHLKTVRDSDNAILARYYYGPDGGRIKKVAHPGTAQETSTYYFNEFVRTIGPNGTTDTVYYYADNTLAAKKEAGEYTFFQPNHLGSTEIITDEQGALLEETRYKPFGTTLAGGDERYLFTGQEKDRETSLQYFNARYYDSEFRRFTQPDSIIQNAYDPQSLNRYAYVRNNPVKYTDPSGNFFDTIADIGFIVWDVVDIVRDPSDWTNWAALGADVVGAAVPFVTGAGLLVKAAARVDDVVKVASKASKVSKAAKVAKTASKASKIGKTAAKATKASKKGKTASNIFLDTAKSKKGMTEWVDPEDLWTRQKGIYTGRKNHYKANFKASNGRYYEEPIRVAEINGRKIIDDGNHRWTAAREARMDKVAIRYGDATQIAHNWGDTLESFYKRTHKGEKYLPFD